MKTIIERYRLGLLSTEMICKLQSDILMKQVLSSDDLRVLYEIKCFYNLSH